MAWTDERIDHLKKLWEKGLTASQIAEELGGVSRNAVIGKAHRLGLKSRPSPVKSGDSKKKAAPKKSGKSSQPTAQTTRPCRCSSAKTACSCHITKQRCRWCGHAG